jgi:hypothetical protein
MVGKTEGAAEPGIDGNAEGAGAAQAASEDAASRAATSWQPAALTTPRQPEDRPMAEALGRRAVLEDQCHHRRPACRLIDLLCRVVGRLILNGHRAIGVCAQVERPVGRVGAGGDEQVTSVFDKANRCSHEPARSATAGLQQGDLSPCRQLSAERILRYRGAPRCQDLPSPAMAGA